MSELDHNSQAQSSHCSLSQSPLLIFSPKSQNTILLLSNIIIIFNQSEISMAGFSSRVSLVLSLVFVALSISEAKEILVGGKADAWTVPASESDSLNKWAENSRFRVGDTLVWKYDSSKDSVLRVTKEDYTSCNTSSPIEQHKDAETKIVLDKSGPHYFISGVKDHCEKGQKLIVVVLSPRKMPYVIMSPAPAPAAENEGPAVAPTSSASALKGSLVVAIMGVLAVMM